MMESIFKTAEGERLILDQYRHLLDRWPVANEHLKIPTREGETFVIASGDPSAHPLLVFHGGMTNSIIWIKEVEVWSKYFRVHAVDVIGEPGLSAQSRLPVDSDAHALWIDDVLDGLSVEHAAFVGASLGGWLALDYAVRRPHRVDKLAVLCPAGVGKQLNSFFFKAMVLLLLGNRGKRKLRELVFGRQTINPSREMQYFLDYLATIQQHVRPRVTRLRVFTDDELEKLSMPVLAIVGETDVMFDSIDTKNRLEKHATNARVNVLPQAGHFIINQADVILDFLK